MKYLTLLTCFLFISTSDANYSYSNSNSEKNSGTREGAQKREEWEQDSIGTSRAATLRRDTTKDEGRKVNRSATSERCVDSNGMVFYKNEDGFKNCMRMQRSR